MKKLLAIAVVSMVSLSCMAGHHSRTISINNHSGVIVDVRDKDSGNSITVDPGQSTSMEISVNEPHGSLFPSFLLPHVTEITVTDDDKNSNSIKIDENTKSVTINEGLQLTLDSNEKQDSRDTQDSND